jgi:hypothetical protein
MYSFIGHLGFPEPVVWHCKPMTATREEPSLRENFKTDGSHMNRAANIASPDPASIPVSISPLATRNASGRRYDASIPSCEGN